MDAFNETKNWIANSITIKCLIIGFIILMLLIPAHMIRNLISERESLRDTVADEIFSKWGNSQTIAGPVITVPYYWYGKEDKKSIQHLDYAHFLPNELVIGSDVETEIRYRGIYKVIVYNTRLQIQGKITRPDFSIWKTTEEDILWDEAFISVGIPDMRGIKKGIKFLWDNEELPVQPGLQNVSFLRSGIRSGIFLKGEPVTREHTFEILLNLNGSESLNFVPAGKTTQVKVSSSWSNPSFDGAFLPETRDIRTDGFAAEWNILDLNRNYPQQWKDDEYNFVDSVFGVHFLIPVNEYRKTFRSVKYSIMFLSLTFLVFLFVEILGGIRIHPIQYLLVGLALLIFYVLLLSLSEQISLNMAYLLSSVAITGMISAYARTIFKNWKQTIIMSLCLIVLYGFLFIILQLQDYALLLGSIGLFLALGITMYLSRKINWYSSFFTKNRGNSPD